MENQRLKAKGVKNKHSISDPLTRLGYEPAKRVRNERLYLSMLRYSDTAPSFSVNDKQGTWFDFGEDKRDNIIDFGLRYCLGLSFNEVLENIVKTCTGNIRALSLTTNYKRKSVNANEPNYEILEFKTWVIILP